MKAVTSPSPSIAAVVVVEVVEGGWPSSAGGTFDTDQFSELDVAANGLPQASPMQKPA